MVDRHAWAASVVAAESGEHLLEIGCGSARAAELVLQDLGSSGRLHAIDRSAVALRQASARCAPDIADGRLRIEQVELSELKVPAATFDGAWAMNVNVFWTTDPEAELAALRRALRPQGRLLLLWDLGPTTVDKLGPLRGRLAAGGFVAVEQESTHHGVFVRARAPAG